MAFIMSGDETINIDSISHIRLVENRQTKEFGLLIFLNGNRKNCWVSGISLLDLALTKMRTKCY